MNIRLEDIGHQFGKRQVLSRISFEIREGSFYGVTGDNGSGKTTLFRIIAGLIKPTSGVIYYDEEPWKMKVQEITYMHQKPYLMRTSVEENIAYPLRIRGFQEKEIKTEVHRLLQELELEDISKEQANDVSGGEAQKIALARALIFQPKVLLMDEPTANIDPETKECIFEIIKKRQTMDGFTTLMITHEHRDVRRYFDQLISLERGGLCCV